MARSRRRTSRTTTQRAAGLIALALPAPVQRVADTRLGSLLMLVGAPVLIMFGLLNVTWVDGFPTFTFNRNKAAELRNAASQHINNLENQAISQNWGQSTVDFLHAAQGPNHGHQVPVFPSTRPQTASQTYNPQQQTYQPQTYGQQQYSEQQYPASYQQPQLYQQQQYPTSNQQQQQYQQQQYQQQPTAGYQQPNATSYQYGSSSQALQQQPYAGQPSRTFQQPTQQWPTGYAQQQPYQANAAGYTPGQQGSYYPPQQNSYPLPSSSPQGKYGRY